MKKTFKLQVENKNQDRIVESIKNEIRKYIKREQRKPLPADKNYWFFDCKFAKNEQTPREIPFADIIRYVNEAVDEKCETFYLEIISKAEKRVEKVDENKIEEIIESSNEEEVKED
ncbi:MAG: DUF6172 family protein [Halarcobacter sp.]